MLHKRFIIVALSFAAVMVLPVLCQSLVKAASLVGLNTDQSGLFQSGLRRFSQIESTGSGLGPAYNSSSCASCHNQPAVGGVGYAAVIRAGILRDGRYAVPPGGDLVHLFSIGDHSCQPRIGEAVNHQARRIATPLFGAGLVEAIPDSAIRTWEDPEDRNGDGVRGRAALVTDPTTNTLRVGRFGWKAHQATLLAFSGEAFRNEMGVTNDIYPHEIGAGLSPEQLAKCDAVRDPDDRRDPMTNLRAIDQVTTFMRFLAPAPATPLNAETQRGSQLFSRIGCAACHVPTLLTGPSDIAALDHRPVNAYSDFLLHDVGTGDGVEQGAARGEEFRTSPLWGLRHRRLLLHDGSALSPAEAIVHHGKESERSRQAFQRLEKPEKRLLLEFLASI